MKKALLAVVLVGLAATVYANQVITCKTWAGAIFVWNGPSCPPGSIQTF